MVRRRFVWPTRALILVLVAAFASSPERARAAEAVRAPKLLSYRSLMDLSEERRELYLHGVRETLVEIEKATRRSKIALQSQPSPLMKQFLAFSFAYAQTAGKREVVPEFHEPSSASYVPSIANGIPILKDLVPKATWKCPDSKDFVFSGAVGGCVAAAALKYKNSGGVQCPLGSYSARVDVKGRVEDFCIHQDSYYSQGKKRREQLSSRTGADDVSSLFGSADRKAEAEAIAFGRQKELDAFMKTVRGSALEDLRTQKCMKSLERMEEICDPEKNRDAFYQGNRNECIFSGNVSSYKNGVIKKGNCDPVTSFTFTANGKSLKCKAGESICSPLLFAVKKDGSPFCAPARGAATEFCANVSTDASRMPDFLNQDTPGVSERWEEFRSAFNRTCNTDVSLRFHCSECKIIRQRIVAMNAMVAQETKWGVSSCEVLIDGEGFRLLQTAPSKRSE